MKINNLVIADIIDKGTISNIKSTQSRIVNHVQNSAQLYSYPSHANIKFILDSNKTFASAFEKTTTIGEVKDKLADVLDVKREMIKFKNENIIMTDSTVLTEITNNPWMITQIRQESTDEETTIIEQKVRENIPNLDVITVHLPADEGQPKNLVVQIENEACEKLWLGGYRNKVAGVEYHHASTQTRPKLRVYNHSNVGFPTPLLFNRDTQTPYQLEVKETSTPISRGTQMWRHDHYIPSVRDKILTPKPYKPYIKKVMPAANIEKVKILQRAVRSWLCGKHFVDIIKLERKIVAEKKNQQLQIIMDQENRERQVVTSAVYPTSRDDFYVLYLSVGQWLKNEKERIFNNQTEITSKSCKFLLLQKQVNLLFEIEKQRIHAKQESLKNEEIRFLERTARPKVFKNAKGQVTSVDDRNTQLAREFKEIYSQLVRTDLKPTTRIDFLIIFKNLFSTYYKEYEFFTDLISLIDREINLLTIGTKQKDLKGLRMRIEQLFMHFLRREEFNPKASKYKKPNWPKTIDSLYRCNRCNQLLPPSRFPVHIRMKAYEQCTSCTWLKNISVNRADLSPYLKLLRKVQRNEMEKCCHLSVCFVLQQIGMEYLTNVIWHGCSIISECREIRKLQHLRWLEDVEWAPWNTILLTEQEAKIHSSIPDIFDFYEKDFITKVHCRHMIARTHFVHLLKMDHYLHSTGAWQNINDSGPYFHPSHAKMFTEQNDYDIL